MYNCQQKSKVGKPTLANWNPDTVDHIKSSGTRTRGPHRLKKGSYVSVVVAMMKHKLRQRLGYVGRVSLTVTFYITVYLPPPPPGLPSPTPSTVLQSRKLVALRLSEAALWGKVDRSRPKTGAERDT